jgi:hypothetical protein
MTMQRTPDRERILQQLLQEREKFVGDKEQEILLAYKLTFESAPGRIVLEDLERAYGGITFTPGYADVSAFKEGRRSVADDIRAMLKRAEVLGVMPPPPRQKESEG